MLNPSPTAIRWWWTGFAAFLGLLIIGCADTRTRYQVLSFFFDGVPDPDHKTSTTRRTGREGTVLYVHKPFADAQDQADKCNVCHLNTSDIFARAQVRRDVCLECHKDVKLAYPVMHGPVANDLCSFCHAAHQSVNEHLLKTPVPKVCTQCHDQELLSTSPPEHVDPKSNCLSCHYGHGGHDHNFLKPSAAPVVGTTAIAPATRPATADEREVRQ